MAVSNIRAAMTDSMVTCDTYEKDMRSTKWLQRNFASAEEIKTFNQIFKKYFCSFYFFLASL